MGVVSVSLDGGGSVSLLFDRPDSFANSFLRLRQALAQNEGRGHTEVLLYRTTLGDGSSISLPRGWNVTNVGRGAVDLEGPYGEEMSLGAAAFGIQARSTSALYAYKLRASGPLLRSCSRLRYPVPANRRDIDTTPRETSAVSGLSLIHI